MPWIAMTRTPATTARTPRTPVSLWVSEVVETVAFWAAVGLPWLALPLLIGGVTGAEAIVLDVPGLTAARCDGRGRDG